MQPEGEVNEDGEVLEKFFRRFNLEKRKAIIKTPLSKKPLLIEIPEVRL